MDVNKLAELIYQKKWEKENEGFQFSRESLDPATIAIIIEIIIKIVECYLGKDKELYQKLPPSEFKFIWVNMLNPTFLDKISLRKIIFSVLGMRGYIKDGNAIHSAILDVRPSLGTMEICQIVRSIK